jgi:hypothetical protein
MDFIKDGMQNLKSIGFGAAVPGLRDKVFNAVSNVTASDEDQKAKIKSVIDEQDALKSKEKMAQGRVSRKEKPIASNESGYKGYKAGGKTASKRADGIAQRGKTKGRMV